MNIIKILLVEDNVRVRRILEDMLILEGDLAVVGAVSNGLAALQLLDEGLETDIVLADLNMDGMGGIELTEKLTAFHSELKVIVLTMHAKVAYLERVMAAGAYGYLLKNGDMEELYQAIRKVNNGELFISDDVIR